MANPWELNWAGKQAGDPVIAPPDPYKQAGEARDERRLDIAEEQAATSRQTANLQNQLTEMKIAESADKREEKAKADAEALKADEIAEYKLYKAITNLSDIALDADDNGGWFETGTSGSFSRSVLPSGSAGYALAGDLKTLDANFAFDALSAMREASKTGGALGNVTERELDLLKASVANLDPDLDHDTFLGNIEEARQAYLAQLARINPRVATQLGYDAAAAENIMLELDKQYAEKFGLPRATVDRSASPVTSDATPADIEAIMAKYGAQ